MTLGRDAGKETLPGLVMLRLHSSTPAMASPGQTGAWSSEAQHSPLSGRVGQFAGFHRVDRGFPIDRWQRLAGSCRVVADRLPQPRPVGGRGRPGPTCYASWMQLHRALRRRDIFVGPSVRWEDPRAQLLGGNSWDGVPR